MHVETSDLDRFASRRSTVYAPNGIIATSQPMAATAGVTILQNGGNAFDAAVASAATLNVVEPTSTGIGGDVFALYRTGDGEIGGLRSCGGAPSDATISRVRRSVATVHGIDPNDVRMPFRGAHSVTVPGTARGWEATIDTFGNLDLADVLEPAIHYAFEGYPVTEVIADHWRASEALFHDKHARDAYLPNGRAPTTGETVRLPKLGASLEAIASGGADVVYEGHIGEQIVAEVQRHGGFMSPSDLSTFEPEFVEPVHTGYHGVDVYELPPNNQGLIVLEALNIADEIGVDEFSYASVDRIHYLVEAMKLAFHDGHRYITDPDYESIPPLGSRSWARKRARSIEAFANNDPEFGLMDTGGEDADTVLLTVADDEGNLVSYINSRFAGFGSGLVAGETGIALQNRGGSFSLDPDHPNRLEPGKRPFHTLIPGLARFDEDDWAAFGVMGGFMQPQGHVQLLSNLIDYDMSLQAAIDAPRWRYRADGRLAVEARTDSSLQTGLVRRGHDVCILDSQGFGGGQIVRARDETFSAATESRLDGIATGY